MRGGWGGGGWSFEPLFWTPPPLKGGLGTGVRLPGAAVGDEEEKQRPMQGQSQGQWQASGTSRGSRGGTWPRGRGRARGRGRDASEGGEVPPPPLLQGAQPMPSHSPPNGKCQLQWHS